MFITIIRIWAASCACWYIGLLATITQLWGFVSLSCILQLIEIIVKQLISLLMWPLKFACFICRAKQIVSVNFLTIFCFPLSQILLWVMLLMQVSCQADGDTSAHPCPALNLIWIPCSDHIQILLVCSRITQGVVRSAKINLLEGWTNSCNTIRVDD